jgi:hypothetical protein
MSINSPSKYLSIKFLSDLKQSRYCSHDNNNNVKEYDAYEVDALYNEKATKQAERLVMERDKFERDFSDTTNNKSVDALTDMIEFLYDCYDKSMYKDVMKLWDKHINKIKEGIGYG